jgi:indole-3-glycerol phosphate synthase
MADDVSRLLAIAAEQRRAIEDAKRATPPDAMRARARQAGPVRDFEAALRDGFAVIGEIKRASPAAGRIQDDVDAAAMARAFVAGGARALAVWTNEKHFNGDLALLREMRAATTVPILRKEFILDAYQVYESRTAGADAVLLIAAILDVDALRGLIALAGSLGMAAPVSVHREVDVDTAIAAGARIVFVHNRNVGDFTVELAKTALFKRRVPPGVLVVSESGIATPGDVAVVRPHADAILVGMGLMASADPAATVRALREAGAAF